MATKNTSMTPDEAVVRIEALEVQHCNCILGIVGAAHDMKWISKITNTTYRIRTMKEFERADENR